MIAKYRGVFIRIIVNNPEENLTTIHLLVVEIFWSGQNPVKD